VSILGEKKTWNICMFDINAAINLLTQSNSSNLSPKNVSSE